MLPKICSIPECETPVGKRGAKGLCPKHYAASRPPCVIVDCGKVQASGGYCAMHNYRIKTSGSPHSTTSGRMNRSPNEVCEVDGCGQPKRKRNWCASHYAQWQREGEVRPFLYKWGDGGYIPAHTTLRNKRGKASEYKCVDCGSQAQEWSYAGGCPNEIVDRQGLAFSRDLSRYDPRCIRCHRHFDEWRVKVAA